MTTPPHPWLPVRTRRLILRDFLASDFDDVHAYGADPEVARFMDWGPNTLEDTQTFVARVLAAQAASPRLDFGVAMELGGAVVGSIGLHMRDEANRTMEIGYCLRRDLWRRGLVSEAARAVMDAGFGALGLHRIFATCDTRNTGSWGVMEKLGMRREACLRRDRMIKGEWRDTFVYAVLAEEWAAGA